MRDATKTSVIATDVARPWTLLSAIALSCCGVARAAEPTVGWVVAQAVPSPELARDDEATRFGLRWQLTPFLWSWGIHRRNPRRWRAFDVEPTYRVTGSAEWVLEPEWLRSAGFDGRTAIRTWLPLVERGEWLALSIASGVWFDGRRLGPATSIGLHVLFGMVGVELGDAAGLRGHTWTATLKLRIL